MRRVLRDLVIEEVSLVDAGVDAGARVVLVKGALGGGRGTGTPLGRRLAAVEAERRSLAARLAALEAERALGQAVTIAKRELAALPGSDLDKGRVWQAVEQIADAEVRAVLQRMLRAGAFAHAQIQQPLGVAAEPTAGDGAGEPLAALQAAARAIAARDGVDAVTAFARAVAEQPQLYERYRRG